MAEITKPQLTADLRGHTLLITGGGTGIGRATAELFAGMGARVAVNHLPGDECAEAAVAEMQAAGLEVIAAPTDVGVGADAEAMVADVIDRLGRLDWLVSNAGLSLVQKAIPFSDLDALTDDFWQRIMSVNFMAAFHCARAAGPALRESRGAIVTISSSAADGKRATSIPYAASKGALISLTRSLAKALAPEVRVNAISPGYVTTPMTQRRGPEHRKFAAGMRLLQRVAEPVEIAELVLCLCIGAHYVTGEVIAADGGLGY